MSFKKKLFNSNIKVAIIPITVFILLVVFMLSMYRHYIMDDLTKNGLTDETTIEILHHIEDMDKSILEDNTSNFEEWAEYFEEHNFGLTIVKNGKCTYSEGPDVDTSSYDGIFKDSSKTINDVPIASVNHSKIIISFRTEYNGSTYYIISKAKNHHFSLSAMDERSIYIGLILFFTLITITIILLCRIYSKRSIKQLSTPIDMLGESAKRIENGDLDTPAIYDNDDEFKPVFDSFNEMQSRLKQSILLTLEHEKKQQEMISEISHDLKTPLTAIKGYIKGLSDGVANTPEKRQHYLDRISGKTDDMIKMIDEILIFSRLERDKVLFNLEPVEIVSYLKELAKSTCEEYSDDTLVIDVDETSKTEYVLIDTLQFNRVFENIISNSYKYRISLPVKITIKTNISKDTIAIHIKDNGAGVDPDKIAYIFDTFYRTDESRNNPVKGSGLGLAICKQIITNLGGTISAYNNNGLCIKIKLNRYKGGNHE